MMILNILTTKTRTKNTFQDRTIGQGGEDDEVLIRRRTMIWVTLAIVPDWTCHLLTVVEMDGDCRSPCQRRCWLGSLSWVLGWVSEGEGLVDGVAPRTLGFPLSFL